jgi:hypothetical protein
MKDTSKNKAMSPESPVIVPPVEATEPKKRYRLGQIVTKIRRPQTKER